MFVLPFSRPIFANRLHRYTVIFLFTRLPYLTVPRLPSVCIIDALSLPVHVAMEIAPNPWERKDHAENPRGPG